MGLDFIEQEETIPKKPTCDKCKNELKANNMFSVDEDKTLCGDCRTKYLEHVRKFYNS